MGETPHCRKCDYNLTGAVAPRCPECGADLNAPHAIVRGQSRRRGWLIALGCVLSVAFAGLAALTAIRASVSIDLYRHAPLWWVVGDLESGQPPARGRAVRELERRWLAGALTKEHCAAFIELLLSEQQTGTPTPGLTDRAINLLGAIMMARDATEEQAERFLSNLVRIELRTRKQVLSGRPVPYEIVAAGACPETGFEAVVTSTDVRIDGKADASRSESTSIISGSHARASRSGLQTLTLPPGPHNATCDVKVEIYPTGPGSVSGLGATRSEKPLRIYERRLSAPFEIVESEAPDAFTAVTNPVLDGQMRQALAIDKVRLEPGSADDPQRLTLQLTADSRLPAAVASELIAELDDGRRVSVGFVRLTRLENTNQLTIGASCPLPAPRRARIRLVPRREAAATSVDIQQYWGGEIDFGEFALDVAPDSNP